MQERTKFHVGLDVQKVSTSAAVGESDRAPVLLEVDGEAIARTGTPSRAIRC